MFYNGLKVPRIEARVGDFFFSFLFFLIRFIWFKSDILNLNHFFIIFRSNHPTPLEVNQSSSAQYQWVANSNYAIKIKQIYIQMKEINEIKSWKHCVEIRGKSNLLSNDEIHIRYKWPVRGT